MAGFEKSVEDFYNERDSFLSEMGFSSQQEFYVSAIWDSIKQAKLEKHPTCQICGENATEVFIKSYNSKFLLGSTLRGLTSLCLNHFSEAWKMQSGEFMFPSMIVSKLKKRFLGKKKPLKL